MPDINADALIPAIGFGNQGVTTPAQLPEPTEPEEGSPRRGSEEGAPRRGPKEVTGTTHKGAIDAAQRARRVAKNLRTASHGGQATHKPCNEYPGCNHPKHGRKP